MLSISTNLTTPLPYVSGITQDLSFYCQPISRSIVSSRFIHIVLSVRIFFFFFLWLNNTPISCCSVAKSCPTVCNPVDYSTPGLPILHYLPLFYIYHILFIHSSIPGHLGCFHFVAVVNSAAVSVDG